MGLFDFKKKRTGFDPIISCPRCDISLVKKTRLGVTIDKCKKCGGLWLDKGEIEKIAARVSLENKKSQAKRKTKER